MESDVSVVIGTFGADTWRQKAQRAIASAEAQTVTPVDIIHVHERTLAKARNAGARRARGSHLVFLDADDELDEHYVGAMTEAVADQHSLYQPATLGIVNGVPDKESVMIPYRPPWQGNCLVIGTMVPNELFHAVGGFKEWEAFEDWDLFWRCQIAGARIVTVPKAIYKVHVNPKGRNSVDNKTASRLFHDISVANGKGL